MKRMFLEIRTLLSLQCPSPVESRSLYFVVMCSICTRDRLEKQLGLVTKYEIWVNTISTLAFDFRCSIIQRIQMVNDFVKLPFGNMFPFILTLMLFTTLQGGLFKSSR